MYVVMIQSATQPTPARVHSLHLSWDSALAVAKSEEELSCGNEWTWVDVL